MVFTECVLIGAGISLGYALMEVVIMLIENVVKRYIHFGG